MAVEVLVSDGADPKKRVLGDGCARRDIGNPVSIERLERSVGDHTGRQAHGGPAVENLLDPGLQLDVREGGHRSLLRLSRWQRRTAIANAAAHLILWRHPIDRHFDISYLAISQVRRR